MREFKFRAWDNKNKKLVSFENIELPYSENVNLDGQIEGLLDRGIILMQYTGLKDKNGIEIYEGDILKVASDGYSNYISFDGAYCYVEYFDKICAFIGKRNKNPKHEICDYFQLETRATVEVVGNIYKNPELLKEGI